MLLLLSVIVAVYSNENCHQLQFAHHGSKSTREGCGEGNAAYVCMYVCMYVTESEHS